MDAEKLEEILQKALREQFTTQITNEDKSYTTIPDRAKYWATVIMDSDASHNSE